MRQHATETAHDEQVKNVRLSCRVVDRQPNIGEQQECAHHSCEREAVVVVRSDDKGAAHRASERSERKTAGRFVGGRCVSFALASLCCSPKLGSEKGRVALKALTWCFFVCVVFALV